MDKESVSTIFSKNKPLKILTHNYNSLYSSYSSAYFYLNELFLKMNYMLPRRGENQELCTESLACNNKAMDSNNNQLYDSIGKYAFKLPTLTKIKVCVLI